MRRGFCLYLLFLAALAGCQARDEKGPRKEITNTVADKTDLPKQSPDDVALEKKDRPKQFTNSIGMKFVWIPPGSFIMGSPKGEKDRQDNETQHKVTLTKGFFMGVHLVTQEQWQEVMGDNPSKFKGEKNLPVEQVSWDDCQRFITKLREQDKDKKVYRLPTEAEWGICLSCGDDHSLSFWRNDID